CGVSFCVQHCLVSRLCFPQWGSLESLALLNPTCHLDEATNNKYSSQIMCDCEVNWNGWYRLFIQGQSVQMPDTCVDQDSCGTHAPLWLNGGHPTIGDGVVTRGVCGHYDNDCCSFLSNPIKVKACLGDYYVYEFVKPAFCFLAYCAGKYLYIFPLFIYVKSIHCCT
uniref:UMOD/GP2/OIT3-like D8C domain-containing protein n=1 Tax=Sinocyclocheilus anshuiensis TaxID=1608454 RepID=A0A671LEP9_9TELE